MPAKISFWKLSSADIGSAIILITLDLVQFEKDSCDISDRQLGIEITALGYWMAGVGVSGRAV
jgi:hypothetical protein